MSDRLISLNAAINALIGLTDIFLNNLPPTIYKEDAIKAVKALPSAQPEPEEFEWCHTCREYDQEKHCCHRWTKVIRKTVDDMKAAQPGWIPCKTALPKESGQYLITVKYVHVDGYEDIYAEHGEWDGKKWDMFCFGYCGEVEAILAWMPLPAPWEGGQDGET